ncbi:MAG: ABC transporter permease [Oscillospiraceae bacterium]|nr:ABC transporter permease [Oscillospiraceae bacterium]
MRSKSKLKADVLSFVENNTAILAVLLLMAFGTASYGMTFLSYKSNLINVLRTASMVGIMGVGVNMCFFIGARDLSVAANAAMTSMFVAIFSKYGFWPSIIIGLLAGGCVGFLNGLVIAKFKVQPFIATLGMQLAARGVALLLNNELSITIDSSATVLKTIGNGNLGGVLPYSALIFIVLILIFSVVMKYTAFGRAVYAVGGNEEAAEMMGIRVDRIKIAIFTISGLMAGICGAVLCGHINAGQPTACEGWEMTIMAAVVIGGTKVRGGTGKIYGVFFGVLFMQFITNLINLNGHLSVYWKDITTGVILLIAVLVQVYSDYRNEKIKNRRLIEEKAGTATA